MCKHWPVILGIALALAIPLRAGDTPAVTADQAVDRIIDQENALVTRLRAAHPLVEIYIQNMKPDKDLGAVPVRDEYFLGKAYVGEVPSLHSLLEKPVKTTGIKKLFRPSLRSNDMRYVPTGFLGMSYIDAKGFDRSVYKFEFVRREFLGEVRCVVFDVTPVNKKDPGRFEGRIWAEDQDYNVVRFNGVFGPQPKPGQWFFHFDTWRVQMGPGVWMPAYIYSEEMDLKYGFRRQTSFKGQVRLWGYNLKPTAREEEFSTVKVEAPAPVQDSSATAPDTTPVEASRLWDRQAEDNVIDRLERAGFMAPAGDLDKVLNTVVTNLEVTNKLDVQPEVRCRVLLTSTLESFSVGHTIILSRGLLDVLPDEASLAAMLAYELGHVLLARGNDTKYAFYDRMLIPDEDVMQQFRFHRDDIENAAAEKKAIELLRNSPYKGNLGSAGLFLRALDDHAKDLPRLISPHLGNRVLNMKELQTGAPAIEVNRTDQIAALPLGGRIKLDPWNDRVELARTKPVALLSPREKMPFEVTPFWPYLTRQTAPAPAVSVSGDSKPAAKP